MSALHTAWALAVTTQAALGQTPSGPPPTPVSFTTAHVGAASPALGWIAPRELSATEGDWGVAFAPRYASLAEAERRRAHDLTALSELLHADPRARPEAQRRIADREASVRTWLARLDAEALASTSPDARRSASDRRLLLLAEASTLQLQAELAHGSGPARAPVQRDRVSVGLDVVIPEGESVRHAVVLGGDLRVEGTLTGDALALGGAVTVDPQGAVHGRTISTTAGASGPRYGLLASLAAYGAILPLAVHALAGAWVREAATTLKDRPASSARVGLGLTLGASAWSLAALGLPHGAPVAGLLSGTLAFGATLGLAATVHALPGVKPWASALALGALLPAIALLPTPIAGALALGAVPGLGAMAVTAWARATR